MSNMKNEKYAIVSSEGEVYVVRKMGVAEKNIYKIAETNQLLRQMSAGDTLCVASIHSFASGVHDLCSKLQFLSKSGIEFKSGNEKFLNFSVVSPLSIATYDTLETMAVREADFMNYIRTEEIRAIMKTQLINRIGWENLAIVSLVFKSEGIKKRGN